MSKLSGKKANLHPQVLYAMGYTIGHTIGEGTYSKVRVANSKTRNGSHKLACKIINKRNAGSEFIQKFLPRELKIIRYIQHANIVGIYNIMEVHNTIYIFMEYCSGGDLLEYIRDNGAVSESLSKYYFRQLSNAVKYLHGLEIAHRDLKCENVLLAGNNQIKLGDFGFSRSCLDNNGQKIFSETFCGSAAYAAPEILQGVSYDPKLYDIWALGCILYIMVTSTMPFDDTNIQRMLRIQTNKSIVNQFKPWKKSCKHIKELLEGLLEPNVNKRIGIYEVAHCKWLQENVTLQLKKNMTFAEEDVCC